MFSLAVLFHGWFGDFMNSERGIMSFGLLSKDGKGPTWIFEHDVRLDVIWHKSRIEDI